MAARKKFIEIAIPLLDKSIAILGTPESSEGKMVKLDLTRELRGKGLEASFQIFNKEGKLIALPKKMMLMNSYITRMMRKRTNYIEDSFKAECADVKTIIKPFLITRKKVSRAVRNHLRNAAREFLLDYVKGKNYLVVCEEILRGNMQKTMLPKLKKIYPLSLCEIRIFRIRQTSDLDSVAEAIKMEKQEEKEEKKEEEKEEKKEEEKEEKKEEEEAEEEVKEKKEEEEEEKPKKKPSKKGKPKKLDSEEKTEKKKTKASTKTKKKDVKKTVSKKE